MTHPGKSTPARIATFAALLCAATLAPGNASAQVKLSESGICHDTDSPWYGRTQTYTAHPDMPSCLSVGRAYSGYDGASPSPRDVSRPSGDGGRTEYDRDLYGRWADTDDDCRNTRHEVLADLSTARVIWGDRGCYVQRGRWNDPYTGRIYLDPGNMDIDHVVPLAWAHARGGYEWSERTRRRFANDPANLIAVDAGANRSKGADGPVDWMPPDAAFHCQYVLRFDRIARSYDLNYLSGEATEMARLRERVCDGAEEGRP